MTDRPTCMVIRYLDHRGRQRYYHGTDHLGGALFDDIENARFFDMQSAQKIMALCLSQDFDVELVPYRESMRCVE